MDLKFTLSLLGRKDEFKKIGPLGDSEIAKFRWERHLHFSLLSEGISLEFRR